MCMHIAYVYWPINLTVTFTLTKLNSMTFPVTFYAHFGIVVGNKSAYLLTVMVILILFRNLDLRNSRPFPHFHIQSSCVNAIKQADKCT